MNRKCFLFFAVLHSSLILICGSSSVSLVVPKLAQFKEDFSVLINGNFPEDAANPVLDLIIEATEKGYSPYEIHHETYPLAYYDFFESLITIGAGISEKITTESSIEMLNFTNKLEIKTAVKELDNVYAFILTDKEFYKPGEQIQIKVFFLNENRQSYHFGPFNVTVVDSEGNTLFKNDEIGLQQADKDEIYHYDMVTDEKEGLGRLEITVFAWVKNRYSIPLKSKFIYIGDAVIPNVEVIASSEVTVRTSSEDNFKLKVIPKFMNGLRTKGELSITAITLTNQENDETIHIENYRFPDDAKYLAIDREKTFEFDIERDFKLSKENTASYEIHFDMVFKEFHTAEEVIFGHKSIICAQNCVSIELKEKSKFIPGLPMSLDIGVTVLSSRDASETNGIPTNVEMIEMQSDREECEGNDLVGVHQEKLLYFGNENFIFNTSECANQLNFSINVMNTSRSFQVLLNEAQSEYIKLSTESKLGGTIELKIATNDPLSLAFKSYHIVVKSGPLIIYHKTAVGEDVDAQGFQEHTFEVSEDFSEVDILCYRVTEDGELIYDFLKLDKVDEDILEELLQQSSPGLPNKLNIKTSADEVEPGEEIVITVESEPSSTVVLLGVSNQNNHQDLISKELNNLDNKDFVKFYRDFHILSLSTGDDETNPILVVNTADTSKSQAFKNISKVVKDVNPKDNELWFMETFKMPYGENSSHSKLEIERKVPSKCLTWTLIALSLNSEREYTSLLAEKQIKVTKKFFVDVRLPSTLRYNEVARVDVLLMNTMNKSLDFNLTLSANPLISNINMMQKVAGKCKFVLANSTHEIKKLVNVDAESVSSATFYFKPLVIGNSTDNTLTVTAENDQEVISDKVHEYLSVEEEIKSKEFNDKIYIDLRDSKQFKKSIEIFIDEEAHKRSVNVEVTLTSSLVDRDLLEPEKILKISETASKAGKIEYIFKMIQSVMKIIYMSKSKHIDISDLRYRTFIDQTLEIVMKMNNGDGSFSLPAHGIYKRVWTTAYMLEFLGFVRELNGFSVNDSIIADSIVFIEAHQAQNGSFTEAYMDHDSDDLKMKLNVQVLRAFDKFSDNTTKLNISLQRESATKAFRFLNSKSYIMRKNLDYAMWLSIVGLDRQKDEKSHHNIFMNFRRIGIRENNFLFWDIQDNNRSATPIKDIPEKVEIACYTMEYFFRQKELDDDALHVMSWLSHTFRQHGEIIIRDESHVAMRMLLMFLDRFRVSQNHIDVVITNELNQKWHLKINPDEQISTNNKVINSRSRKLDVYATGSGFAMLDVIYSYAVPVKNFKDNFEVQIEVAKTSLNSDKVMGLRVCVNRNDDQQNSGETLHEDDEGDETTTVEIEIPDNYVYDINSIDFLQDFNIKNFFIGRGKTFVKLTFGKFAHIYKCLDLKMIKDLNSVGLRNPTVRVYQSEKQSVSYYTAREIC